MSTKQFIVVKLDSVVKPDSYHNQFCKVSEDKLISENSLTEDEIKFISTLKIAQSWHSPNWKLFIVRIYNA